jgi:glycosyltransferase involved in cell wall biosynthesis
VTAQATERVVVLANTRWESLREHSTRLREVTLSLHARGHGVTVVDYPVFGRPSGPLVSRLESWAPGVANVRLQIPTTGDRRFALADAFGFAVAARALRRAIAAGGTAPQLVICGTPAAARLLGRLGEQAAVFDAIDDMRAHADAAAVAGRVADGYDVVRRRGVAVAAVSAKLAHELGGEWVPNAVDVARFSAPAAAPAWLDELPRPRAVYVGTVEERCDIELLTDLAAAGDMSVVVVGPVHEATTRETLRNAGVHVAGRMAPELLPAVLGGCDVGLVPHRITALTASMDPMKVYEYLAAGLPVVSTPVLDASRFATGLRVVGRDDFVAAVRAAVRERPPADVLRSVVAGRTWDDVADRLLSLARDRAVHQSP